MYMSLITNVPYDVLNVPYDRVDRDVSLLMSLTEGQVPQDRVLSLRIGSSCPL